MRLTHIGSVLVALLGLTGCGGALPDVANAYGDQFGAVETSPTANHAVRLFPKHRRNADWCLVSRKEAPRTMPWQSR